MKRSIVVSIMVLCVSLPSMATVVIGNFEENMDGWAFEGSNTGAYSNFGATLDSYSLELHFLGGWNGALKKTAWMYAGDFANATEITMDVSMRNDNGQVPDWWVDVIMAINSDVTGWKELTKTGLGGLPYDPRTDHVSFEITQEIRDAFAGGCTWADIVILTNSGVNGGTIWFDNVQIVPEPATMSLLTLGALTLLRRRKA